MIAMVFLLIGANLLFTCFSFQGNATEISSEIVNVPVLTQFELTIPVQIAKHYLTFFPKCCKSLLIVPNLLLILFYFQIGNKSENFRYLFDCNSNWVGDTFHGEDLFQGKCC